MVGIARVVRVELPVAVDVLPLIAEDLHGLVHQAPQVVADRLVEIVLQRLGPVGQGAEHDAAKALDFQLSQTVVREFEVPGEAALSLDAPPERHAHQVTGEVVAPLVVDALVLLGVAELLAAHQRAPMGAAVDEGMQCAVLVPAHDHRRVADLDALEVARFGDLRFETQVVPGRSAEDAELLAVVELAIVIDAERDTREVVTRPDVARLVPHLHCPPRRPCPQTGAGCLPVCALPSRIGYKRNLSTRIAYNELYYHNKDSRLILSASISKAD